MPSDEVHNAIWSLQEWEDLESKGKRLPLVFCTTNSAILDRTPCNNGDSVEEPIGKEKTRDPEDRRVVDPHEDLADGSHQDSGYVCTSHTYVFWGYF